MSLLMDALKKAESNKQEAARALAEGDVSASAASDGLSLAPLGPAPDDSPPSTTLPDLADHIAAVNADLAATAATPAGKPATTMPPPRPATNPAAESANRQSVRNAFAVKQPAPGHGKPLRWLLIGLGLVICGIAGYFWYQLQAINHSTLSKPAEPRKTLPSTANPAITDTPHPASAIAALPVPQAPTIFAPNKPSTVGIAETRPPPPPNNEIAPTIRFRRTPAEVDGNLLRGHGKLQGNAVDEARQDYELALRADPNNVDTLLGLAAIAQRQGHLDEAERFRRRALEAAPQDPEAQAAALGSQPNADPLTSESRLNFLLSSQPEAAPLHFALGNLYARQSRWNEAQRAYFSAVAADGGNPDYLFNLAVSLDHLRQPRLAAQHYQLAIEAAAKRAAVFDRPTAARRLAELRQP